MHKKFYHERLVNKTAPHILNFIPSISRVLIIHGWINQQVCNFMKKASEKPYFEAALFFDMASCSQNKSKKPKKAMIN
jgi:hypothetical protein